MTCKVDRHGRLMVPASWRRKNGIRGEDEVILRETEDGALRLETRVQAVQRAQALVRRYVKAQPGETVVDEFLAERRAEAEREQS